MRNKRRLTRQARQLGVLLMTVLLFVGLLYSPVGGKGLDLSTAAPVAAKKVQKKHVPTGAIYKVDTDKKIVALTFDISWGEKAPGPILDALEKKDVKKATFFLSGPWASTHQDIAKRIKNMGYEIGNHGNKHEDFPQHTNEWIRDQVSKSEQSIYDVTGVKTTLIRTPNGAFDKRTIQQLNQMGYTVIQWNTDSLDWMRPGVDQIVNRVVSKAVPGDIILLHASDSALQTIDALPKIIDGLRAKGYEFVTVSEMLNNSHVESKQE